MRWIDYDDPGQPKFRNGRWVADLRPKEPEKAKSGPMPKAEKLLREYIGLMAARDGVKLPESFYGKEKTNRKK
jgi:hypothetical protein